MEDGLVSLLVDQIGDVVVVETDTRDAPPRTLKGAARELIRGAYQLPSRLLLDLDLDRALALDASQITTRYSGEPAGVSPWTSAVSSTLTRSASEGERSERR
jgi:chemotaxis signal transduction protein